MNFLPVIERELRVRSRNRMVYWGRSAVVFLGGLICFPLLAFSDNAIAPQSLGNYMFNGIVATAFLMTCVACLLTAESVSAERSEGTLGLLLLTRVRSFDVLIGKLGSTGLAALCTLVAFLPVLMIPVLAGGVTGGEAFRKGLALLDSLFFSLAVGLWASSRPLAWQKITRNALLVVLLFALVPYLLEAPFGGRSVTSPRTISLLSPLTAIVIAGDLSYKASPAPFWISLAVVNGLSWLLLVAAVFRLERSVRETHAEVVAPVSVTGVESDGREAIGNRQRFDGRRGPVEWLVRRQRGMRLVFWIAALIAFLHYGFFGLFFRFIGAGIGVGIYPATIWPLSLAFTAASATLLAFGVTRFLISARRTGEFELLLTTPLGAETVVSAQWNVLKRVLRGPLVLMLAPVFLQILVMTPFFGSYFYEWWRLSYGVSIVLQLANTIVGLGALCWLGIWFGLKARNQGGAVLWTIGLAKFVPFLISMVGSLVFTPLFGLRSGSTSLASALMWALPQFVTLGYYLWLIRRARRLLVGELRDAPTAGFAFRLTDAAKSAASVIHRARHWTPS
jgi:ABC-type transport system involved in multi-copper enzyme maturation permease subunit